MSSAKSSYRDVSSRLRDRILKGTYPAGAKLPSERDLSVEFGISRITLRRALQVLAEELLIHRIHGSGTYVTPNPTRRIPIMIDYSGSIRKHAPKLSRQVLLWKWQQLPWASEMLEIEPTDMVFYAERLDTLEDALISWDNVVICASFARRLDERHLARVDFLEAWTRASEFSIESCRQYIEAVPAKENHVAAMKVELGEALLKSTEIFLTYQQRPAGLLVSYYHPKKVCMYSVYQWSRLPGGSEA